MPETSPITYARLVVVDQDDYRRDVRWRLDNPLTFDAHELRMLDPFFPREDPSPVRAREAYMLNPEGVRRAVRNADVRKDIVGKLTEGARTSASIEDRAIYGLLAETMRRVDELEAELAEAVGRGSAPALGGSLAAPSCQEGQP